MKSTQAGLAIISGLAAVVTADRLPPEGVPFQCATICGPIVELTAICDTHWKRGRKRSRDTLEKIDERSGEGHVGLRFRGLGAINDDDDDDNNDKQKRSFSVIRAAPTSFPPGLLASETAIADDGDSSPTSSEASTTSVRPTSRLTRIIPVVQSSTSTSTNPRSPSSSPSTSTLQPTSIITLNDSPKLTGTTFSSIATTTSTKAPGDVAAQKGQNPGNSKDNAEQKCVCLNDSFNVAEVSALCSSCIAMAGFPDNDMDMVMSECKFAPLEWSPNKDSIANNIRVKATKPSALAGYNAGVASNANMLTSTSLGIAAGLVSIVIGATMLL